MAHGEDVRVIDSLLDAWSDLSREHLSHTSEECQLVDQSMAAILKSVDGVIDFVELKQIAES